MKIVRSLVLPSDRQAQKPDIKALKQGAQNSCSFQAMMALAAESLGDSRMPTR